MKTLAVTVIAVSTFLLTLALIALALSGCNVFEMGGARYVSVGGKSFDRATVLVVDPNRLTFVEIINYDGEKVAPVMGELGAVILKGR